MSKESLPERLRNKLEEHPNLEEVAEPPTHPAQTANGNWSNRRTRKDVRVTGGHYRPGRRSAQQTRRPSK